MKTEKYYRLELDDYATPGFVSGGKYYFTTADRFMEWLTALEHDEQMAVYFEMLLTAFREYNAGHTEVTHTVGYNEVPFFKTATILHTECVSFEKHQWEHINIYGFPYNMRCERVDTRHLWLFCDRKYYRYVEARFEKLEYESITGEWNSLDNSFWGYPEVLTSEEGITWNRLAEREKSFNDREETEADWKSFCSNPIPDFTEFCNDIFGDG
ncbi:MAG: hypothetical protein ACI3W5_08525 [Faecousia sp.]